MRIFLDVVELDDTEACAFGLPDDSQEVSIEFFAEGQDHDPLGRWNELQQEIQRCAALDTQWLRTFRGAMASMVAGGVSPWQPEITSFAIQADLVVAIGAQVLVYEVESAFRIPHGTVTEL